MVFEAWIRLQRVCLVKEVHILAIPILFLLGIGITTLFDGAVRAFRRRDQVSLHWLPFAWSVIILLFLLQLFCVLWRKHLEPQTEEWTWFSYSLILIHPVMYFVASRLIWPDADAVATEDLLTDFERHGRWAVAVIGLTLFLSVVLIVYAYGATWAEAKQPNILNILLAGLSVLVVSFPRNRWLSLAATLGFLAIQTYALLYVWWRPGDVGL